MRWMFKCLGWQRDVATFVSGRKWVWYGELVILQFMCVGCWAGVTYLRYTMLTSPKKGETAVHCCDPTLSVLVRLVSRNVFHVVSALHSTLIPMKHSSPLEPPAASHLRLILSWETRNCKGPHTINAANVGSTRDLISQNKMYEDKQYGAKQYDDHRF